MEGTTKAEPAGVYPAIKSKKNAMRGKNSQAAKVEVLARQNLRRSGMQSII